MDETAIKIVKLVICVYCHNQNIKDLTQEFGADRHYFCPNCGAHNWNSQWKNKQQWNQYINS